MSERVPLVRRGYSVIAPDVVMRPNLPANF